MRWLVGIGCSVFVTSFLTGCCCTPMMCSTPGWSGAGLSGGCVSPAYCSTSPAVCSTFAPSGSLVNCTPYAPTVTCPVDTCSTTYSSQATYNCEHDDPCARKCGPGWQERFEDGCYRLSGWLDEESYMFLDYSKCKTKRVRKLFSWSCDDEDLECAVCPPTSAPPPTKPLIPPAKSYGLNPYASPNPGYGSGSGLMVPPPAASMGRPGEVVHQGAPPEPEMYPLGDGSWASPWREVTPGTTSISQVPAGSNALPPAAAPRASFGNEPTLVPVDTEEE